VVFDFYIGEEGGGEREREKKGDIKVVTEK
jgi:hypothetical protein